MIIIEVAQGTPAWHALRAKHNTASEAPVMMNASSKMRRNDLLHMKATGTEKEICAWVQKNLFDKGHAQEASSRVIVEKMIDQELYPATATDDEGYLLASFDGITMMQDVLYEHKMWNEKLAQSVRDENLDPEYYWQLEQQLLVSGAEYVCFTVSDGTRDKFVSMDYYPVEGRADQLLAGWAQFDKDLAKYVPVEAKEVVVAKTIKSLPALAIQLKGEVSSSNLAIYKETALGFIENINTNLKTDQEFADAEAMVKFCDKAEKELELVKSQALSQTASIDELFRTIDLLKEEMRKKRLILNSAVTKRKEAIRIEIKEKADADLFDHLAALNARVGPRVRLPHIVADFVGVMKSKRTIASLQDAVDSELARVKIESNAIADKIDENLKCLRELDAKYLPLFRDAQELVLKDNADVVNIIKVRVLEADELEKETIEAARLEAERVENERAEEERLRLERVAEEERLAEDAAAKKPVEPEPEQVAPPAEVEPPAQEPESEPEPAPKTEAVIATVAPKSSNAVAETFTASLVNMKLLAAAVGSGSAPASLLKLNDEALAAFVQLNGRKYAIPGISITSAN